MNHAKKKQYVGYMYGTDSNPYDNINDSDIKKVVDNWYKEKILGKSIEAQLDKKSIYCGDRTEYKDIDQISYGSYNRVLEGNPSMKCKINDGYSVESGNKKLLYPVALLSADEVNIAGNSYPKYGVLNTDNYLNDIYNSFWTLSPLNYALNGNAVVFCLNGSYGVGAVNAVWDILNVRPAITIKGGELILSGDGSQNNPYVI